MKPVTNKEIAEFLGIHEKSFYKYSKKKQILYKLGLTCMKNDPKYKPLYTKLNNENTRKSV